MAASPDMLALAPADASPADLVTQVTRGPADGARQLTVYGDGPPVRVSLAELDRLATRAAAALRAAGVEPGDRIGIVARNGPGWIVADLAALKLGAVTAGFEAGRIAPEPRLLDRYGLKLLLTDTGLANGSNDRIRGVDWLLQAARADDAPAAAFAPAYAAGDTTTIKFTSGSTGEPKGLAATAGSIGSSLIGTQALFAHGLGDVLFVFLPLSLLQQRYWIYSAMLFGHDIVVSTHEFAFVALAREQPTVVMGVPGFFDAVRAEIAARASAAGEPDDAALRQAALRVLGSRVRYLWTGSAPANVDTLDFFNRCGVAIFEGYGMNETCIVTKNAPGAHRRGSVGRPLPGRRVTLDEDGVIIVHSEYPVNTAYLFAAPGESERIFRADGSIYTGDLGEIDADGFLYIRGRLDDLVALGNGRNLLVCGIETRLRQNEAVADGIVTGVDGRLEAILCLDSPSDAPAALAHVAAVNRDLPAEERITAVALMPERFTVENDLATSQFKPRRKEIVARARTLPRHEARAA